MVFIQVSMKMSHQIVTRQINVESRHNYKYLVGSGDNLLAAQIWALGFHKQSMTLYHFNFGLVWLAKGCLVKSEQLLGLSLKSLTLQVLVSSVSKPDVVWNSFNSLISYFGYHNSSANHSLPCLCISKHLVSSNSSYVCLKWPSLSFM